jgi:hypothetical protein
MLSATNVFAIDIANSANIMTYVMGKEFDTSRNVTMLFRNLVYWWAQAQILQREAPKTAGRVLVPRESLWNVDGPTLVFEDAKPTETPFPLDLKTISTVMTMAMQWSGRRFITLSKEVCELLDCVFAVEPKVILGNTDARALRRPVRAQAACCCGASVAVVFAL